MKIKHLVLAVVVVMLAGFGTGVAIGGKEKTVIVEKEVAARPATPTTEPEPAPDPAPSTPDDQDEPAPPDDSSDEASPDAIYLADISDITPSDEVSSLDTNQSVELQDGNTYDYSTSFELTESYSDFEFYTVEIPVPQGKTQFRARVGFAKGVPTQHEVGIAFLGDKLVNGTTLRKEKTLDATDDDVVNVDVTGVRTLIVRLRPKLAIADEQWESPTFVLAEARFE